MNKTALKLKKEKTLEKTKNTTIKSASQIWILDENLQEFLRNIFSQESNEHEKHIIWNPLGPWCNLEMRTTYMYLTDPNIKCHAKSFDTINSLKRSCTLYWRVCRQCWLCPAAAGHPWVKLGWLAGWLLSSDVLLTCSDKPTLWSQTKSWKSIIMSLVKTLQKQLRC